MKRWLLAALLVCLFSLRASAQTAVDELENRLRGREPAAPASEPGYLGIVADDRGLGGRGLRIIEVTPGGPAAAGGLAVGDLIVAINDRAVRTMNDMAALVGPLGPGEVVEFEFYRGEGPARVQKKLPVMLGRRPAADERRFPDFGPVPLDDPADGDAVEPAPGGEPRRGPILGVRTQAIDEATRRRLDLPDLRGALVVSRTVGYPAEKAGIPLDSVIVAVDGAAVDSPAALASALAAADPQAGVVLTYLSGGRTSEAKITFGVVAPIAPSELPRPDRPAPATLEELTAYVRSLERRIESLERELEAERSD